MMIRLCALFLLLCMPPRAGAWLTDSATAYQRARNENKVILFNFTGSDWCGWCIRLKNEVFSQPEFETFARDNLVLLEVDFPRNKTQTAAQAKANAALASGFNIRGYPTVLLVDGQGQVIGRTGYQPGGPKTYVAELQRILGHRVKKPASGAAAPAPPPAPVATAEAPIRPMFGGAPAAPPARFTGLLLKSISGAKSRRLAIINNETLAAGESAMLPVGEGRIKVRCEEIKDQSVVLHLVDTGRRLELQLGGQATSLPAATPIVRR